MGVIQQRFSQLVFMQGEDYLEFEEVLERDGEDAAMDYLIQWDNGDDYDVRDSSSEGAYDDVAVRSMGDFVYLMTWDRSYCYAGLQRVTEEP